MLEMIDVDDNEGLFSTINTLLYNFKFYTIFHSNG